MKKIVLVFLIVSFSVAQVSAIVFNKNVLGARDKGAEFNVLLRIVDDEGRPVRDARCCGWMYMERDRGHGCGYAKQADENGYVRVSGRCSEWFSVVVRKEGYYRTMFDIKYPISDVVPPVVDGKWQPYDEVRKVVLKRIKKPVDMVEVPHRSNKAVPPGTWHGFDLVCGDWLPPYGQGKCLDMLVRLGLEADNDTSDFRATMDVCLTNSPCSGIYRKSKDSESEMKSSYTADTNAVYLSTMSFVFERHPHRPAIDTRLSDNEFLVFRIRTKVGESGKLNSAYYGKIYGLWSFWKSMTLSEVFINPTPNDTNLEDAETARRSRLGYRQSLEFNRH